MTERADAPLDQDSARAALDELFALARKYNSSDAYLELMRFVGRFRFYSPFNAMLTRPVPRRRGNVACAMFISSREIRMSADAIEMLITNAIHTAFIKYPEGDGGPNMDYEWIPPDQSLHNAKAIPLDLEAGGYQIVKKA